MTKDPAKLNHPEILSLVAKGLIEYLALLRAGEADPFPYPDTLVRGFNQLLIACVLQDINSAKRSKSIPDFVRTWASLPLAAWPLKLETLDNFTLDDYLIEPDLGNYPTQLCSQLAAIQFTSLPRITNVRNT